MKTELQGDGNGGCYLKVAKRERSAARKRVFSVSTITAMSAKGKTCTNEMNLKINFCYSILLFSFGFKYSLLACQKKKYSLLGKSYLLS